VDHNHLVKYPKTANSDDLKGIILEMNDKGSAMKKVIESFVLPITSY
jgi:hypothetical protein